MKKLLFAILLTIAGLSVTGDMLAGCGYRGCGRTSACETPCEPCPPKCCVWKKVPAPAQRHVYYTCPKEYRGAQCHTDNGDDAGRPF